ncbi:MAG: glycosyltransferase [Lachnospiraceae bacterium]|nr:glycosyltransferase [Lachnospiraceae bacterium]
MSSLEPNKNFKWIVECAKQRKDQTFVVGGTINKGVFSDDGISECPPNIRLIGYISDEEVKTLMRDCKAFIYPTFYEGFGIPPMEAIAAGTEQVIVSDTEVMHEIYEDNVSYINPYEYACEWDEKKVNRDILRKYSWEKSANKLLEILREF